MQDQPLLSPHLLMGATGLNYERNTSTKMMTQGKALHRSVSPSSAALMKC